MVTKYKMSRGQLHSVLEDVLEVTPHQDLRVAINKILDKMMEVKLKPAAVKKSKKSKTDGQLSLALHKAQQEFQLISEQLLQMSRNVHCTTPEDMQESLSELSEVVQGVADNFSF